MAKDPLGIFFFLFRFFFWFNCTYHTVVNGYRIQTHNKVYYLHTKRSKILNGLGATTNSLPTTNIQPTTAKMKEKTETNQQPRRQ